MLFYSFFKTTDHCPEDKLLQLNHVLHPLLTSKIQLHIYYLYCLQQLNELRQYLTTTFNEFNKHCITAWRVF